MRSAKEEVANELSYYDEPPVWYWGEYYCERTFREAAEVMLEETDKQRAEYYYKNTGKTWGDVNNYHMILNTSDLGIENCADILMRYFEMKDYI